MQKKTKMIFFDETHLAQRHLRICHPTTQYFSTWVPGNTGVPHNIYNFSRKCKKTLRCRQLRRKFCGCMIKNRLKNTVVEQMF